MTKQTICTILVHHPDDPKALSKHIGTLYADSVIGKLKNLSCPAAQKQKILNQIIMTVKNARN